MCQRLWRTMFTMFDSMALHLCSLSLSLSSESLYHSQGQSLDHLFSPSLSLGFLVDSEIVSSTRYGKVRVFINKILSTETSYQQDLINRDRLSTDLIVGKLGQGMRCCKCKSTSNVLVCETQRKVYMYGCVSEWVGSVCVCVVCVCVLFIDLFQDDLRCLFIPHHLWSSHSHILPWPMDLDFSLTDFPLV